jgi:hypothetical protein
LEAVPLQRALRSLKTRHDTSPVPQSQGKSNAFDKKPMHVGMSSGSKTSAHSSIWPIS